MPILSVSRVACALALGLTLGACGGDKQGPGKGGGDRPTTVTTLVVQPRAWNDTVQALGTVKAHESVTVTAKVSETVERVHFDSGDVVPKGAALVTLSGMYIACCCSKHACALRTSASRPEITVCVGAL